MTTKKEILEANYQEYFNLGEDALKKGLFNSAVTLFFKALVTATDLFLLNRYGIAPSSHKNRFRLVEEKNSPLYEILDRDFPFYQDSYTKKLDKEAADLLKEDAQRIKKMVEE